MLHLKNRLKKRFVDYLFLPEGKNKTQLSLSRRARDVADDVYDPILVTSLKFVTSKTSDLPLNVVLIAGMPILFTEN